MRLIDADALIHTHESEVAIIGKDWTVGDLAAAIETAPTIDAIPVEWLKAQNNSTEYYKTVQGQAVELVLELWQKGQEAYHETDRP